MKVEKNKMVAVDYKLTVDGAIADQSQPGAPLEFICGTGMLLPKFEVEVVSVRDVTPEDLQSAGGCSCGCDGGCGDHEGGCSDHKGGCGEGCCH